MRNITLILSLLLISGVSLSVASEKEALEVKPVKKKVVRELQMEEAIRARIMRAANKNQQNFEAKRRPKRTKKVNTDKVWDDLLDTVDDDDWWR